VLWAWLRRETTAGSNSWQVCILFYDYFSKSLKAKLISRGVIIIFHECTIGSFHLSWVELYGSSKVHRLARDSDKHRLCIRWRRRRQPPTQRPNLPIVTTQGSKETFLTLHNLPIYHSIPSEQTKPGSSSTFLHAVCCTRRTRRLHRSITLNTNTIYHSATYLLSQHLNDLSLTRPAASHRLRSDATQSPINSNNTCIQSTNRTDSYEWTRYFDTASNCLWFKWSQLWYRLPNDPIKSFNKKIKTFLNMWLITKLLNCLMVT